MTGLSDVTGLLLIARLYVLWLFRFSRALNDPADDPEAVFWT
jgi:hypothetical protein